MLQCIEYRELPGGDVRVIGYDAYGIAFDEIVSAEDMFSDWER